MHYRPIPGVERWLEQKKMQRSSHGGRTFLSAVLFERVGKPALLCFIKDELIIPKACLDGILPYVLQAFMEVARVTDQPVPVVFLPQRSGFVQESIDLPRSKSFPGFDNSLQPVWTLQSEKRVHMWLGITTKDATV